MSIWARGFELRRVLCHIKLAIYLNIVEILGVIAICLTDLTVVTQKVRLNADRNTRDSQPHIQHDQIRFRTSHSNCELKGHFYLSQAPMTMANLQYSTYERHESYGERAEQELWYSQAVRVGDIIEVSGQGR